MKMKTGEGPWGKHLIVDVRGYSFPVTRENLAWFMDLLIEKLKMNRLGPLHVEEMNEENNKGFSAVQMITTSSISFHEDAITKNVYLDVFSCDEFDVNEVLHLVDDWFVPYQVKHHLIWRE